MSARRLAAAVAVAVLVAGVAAVMAAGDGGAPDAQQASTGTATTEIVRQDLVETQSADGTLGYAGERTVMTTRSGTVTWLPAVGSIVATNRRLFQVDGENIYLLDGTVPVWRTLEPGLTGEDVRQLERNLRELGHDPDHEMDVDGTWDAGTTAAVLRWQDAKGLEETGEIELGRVVFEPGDRRIASHAVTLGGSTSGGGAGGGTSSEGNSGSAQGASASGERGHTVFVGYSVAPDSTTVAIAASDCQFAAAQDPTPTPTPTPAPGATPTPTSTPTPTPTATPGVCEPDEGKEQAPEKKGGQQMQPSGGGQAPSDTGGGRSGGGSGASATAAPSGSGSGGSPTAATGEGATSQSEVMTTTSTRRTVSVDLDTAHAELAKVGSEVSIELPSGDNVTGHVTSVGKVATLPEGEDPEASDATVEVTIRFSGKGRSSGLDQAPADVEFERSRAKDVLAVPVTALMAQSGGGFAVEVRDGGQRRIVPVETGLYTSGFVEIQGEGLSEGMRVTNAEL